MSFIVYFIFAIIVVLVACFLAPTSPLFYFWSSRQCRLVVCIVVLIKILSVPPGQDCHSLSELRADMTLERPRHGVVCGDGGGSCSWLALGSLSPLPWQADGRCPAHLACLAHQ